MCVSGLPAWMYVVPFGVQKEGIRFTRTRVTDSCELDAGSQIWVSYKNNKYSFFFFLNVCLHCILTTVSALSIPPSLPPAPSHPVSPRLVSLQRKRKPPRDVHQKHHNKI